MSDAASVRGSHVPEGIGSARRALLEWVREGAEAGRTFLQVHLQVLPNGRFALRHAADRHLAASELQRHTDPYRAREIAQTTAEGAHRPLKTAPNLRRGWVFEEVDERGLWIALDYLYPACVAHWHAGREGSLRVTQWAETAGRQSGMYSSVRLLDEPALRDTARACCADAVCLRRVAWGLDAENPEPLRTESIGREEQVAAASDADVPCPEACSMFVSFARAVLAVERKPRSPIPGLGMLNAPEIEQIRALVAAASEDGGETVREGEFDLPLNRRRVRYLAVRLANAEEQSEPGGDRVSE